MMMIPKKLTTSFAIFVGVLFVFGIMIFMGPEYRKHGAYERRLEDLRMERAREENRLQDLRVRQQRFQSDSDYVRKTAHELGMVEPHEVIFRFHDDSSRATNRALNRAPNRATNR